jgi:hypothetical protein
MAPKQRTILKQLFQYIIPLVISVGLCIVLYSGVEWTQIQQGLHCCNYGWILAMLGCNLLAQVWRAVRWRMQLRHLGINPGLNAMLCSVFGTYAVNLVFPRLGEIWRCGFIARRHQAQFTTVFGSMVADRLADTASVLLITLLTLVAAFGPMMQFMENANVPVTPLKLIIALAAAAVIVAAVALFIRRSRSSIAARLRTAMLNAWRGFSSLFRMPGKGRWLLLTAAIWLSYFASMVASFMAYPPTAQVLGSYGLVSALVTFVFGSLAMAIPSNGGIGPWQLAIILALSGIYLLPQAQALTFATLNLGFTTLLTIALGLYTFLSILLSRRK